MFLGRSPSFLGDYQPTESAPSQRVAQPPVQLKHIPSGDAGAVATVRIMRDLAKGAVRNPDQIVRTKVRELLSGLPPRQWMAEIRALHAFVRDQIRYLKDPVGVELVQTPEKTLEYGQGDCDDKATLLAAMLSAAGHPARFVAVGLGGGPLSHVLVETQVGPRWIPLETIIDREPGWFPEGVTKAYRLKV